MIFALLTTKQKTPTASYTASNMSGTDFTSIYEIVNSKQIIDTIIAIRPISIILVNFFN